MATPPASLRITRFFSNPLSRHVYTCVILYRCENWVLTDALFQKLACFLGWAGKGALKWPVHSLTPQPCLRMESIKARILTWKLAFLKHLFSEELVGVGAVNIHSLLCIVTECREFEASFRTQFTDQVLGDADSASVSVRRVHVGSSLEYKYVWARSRD